MEVLLVVLMMLAKDSGALLTEWDNEYQLNGTVILDFHIPYRDQVNCTISPDPRISWGRQVDCSNRFVTSIPEPLPHLDVTTLLLDNNNIEVLQDGDFMGFTDLRYLDLSINGMRNITPGAFAGLRQLTSLNLKSNNLAGGWPGVALSQLSNLQVLILDNALPDTLGPLPVGFRNLTHLENLSISALKLDRLNETFFQHLYVESLTELHLSLCTIAQLEAGAFKHFKHLNKLYLNNVFAINETSLQFIFADFNGSDLAWINLFYTDNLITLSPQIFASFKINKLETLILSFSGITSIVEGTFANLAALRNLHLDHTHIHIITADTFSGLNSLQVLDISNTDVSDYNFTGSSLNQVQNLNVSETKVTTLWSHGFSGLSRLKEFKLQGGLVSILEKCAFCGLDAIQRIELTGVNLLHVSSGAFQGLHSLNMLDLTNANLANINDETFSNMTSLKRLTLQQNVFKIVTSGAVRHLPELTTLSMENCNLTSDHGLFQNFPSLRTLNIRKNPVIQISKHAFYGSRNLTYLSVSYCNSVKFLPSALYDLYLDYLDVSYDSLTNLSDSNVTYLSSDRVKLFAGAGNPYFCSCDQVKFLRWFNTTNKIGDDRTVYHCNEQLLSQFDLSLCDKPNILPYVIGFPAGFSLILATVIFTTYRKRESLRLWWYNVRLRRYQKIEEEREDEVNATKLYDAFVSYNELDKIFVMETLKPQLETSQDDDEDTFKLAINGEFSSETERTDNMIKSVNESRKTIFLLSNHFFSDSWWKIAFEIAHSRFKDGEDVIILIVLENINHRRNNLPRTLVHRLGKAIEWTSDHEGQKLFWKRLRMELKKPVTQALSEQ